MKTLCQAIMDFYLTIESSVSSNYGFVLHCHKLWINPHVCIYWTMKTQCHASSSSTALEKIWAIERTLPHYQNCLPSCHGFVLHSQNSVLRNTKLALNGLNYAPSNHGSVLQNQGSVLQSWICSAGSRICSVIMDLFCNHGSVLQNQGSVLQS
jgi:hypothetical protein